MLPDTRLSVAEGRIGAGEIAALPVVALAASLFELVSEMLVATAH